MSTTDRDDVRTVLARINQAWLAGRPNDLSDLFHPSIVMVIPGLVDRVKGRDALIAGFVDFCSHAKVHEYQETDLQVDAIGDSAVATFAYQMIYERSGERYRAKGRDLWVFTRAVTGWLAVWRTMIEMSEEAA